MSPPPNVNDTQLRERIKDAINEALNERDAFDGRTHSDHHRYVEEMIARERRRQQRREQIRQQVVGWGLITMLSGIGYAAYQTVIDWMKRVTH